MALKISKDESVKLIAARPAGEQLEFTATGRLRRSRANGWALRLITRWRVDEAATSRASVTEQEKT